ncbi:NepR family anti-sigma factor [Litorimonas sp. RW-G-Af-16]|uniref:NepR family anti-sigma factor n=1 Tax=Litorimonas sp. RW-G-Af-16 TaxID=3241168 RepID=UPI00390C6594
MSDKADSEKGKTVETSGNFADKPLKEKIGKNLKQIYDDVLNEEVPDDFLALLQKADKP